MHIKNHDIRFDNVHYWPAKIKKTVLVIIGIVVILLGLLLENSLLSSIKISSQQSNQLKKELFIKKIFSTQAQHDLKQLNALQQQENELDLILPSKPNLTEIIQSLSQIAEKNNMVFQTLEPLPESIEDFYRSVPIHGIVMASYQQLGTFINDLSTITRLISIGDFTLQATKNNGVLSLDFTVNGYYYDAHANNSPHPNPPPQAGEGTINFIFTRDPFLLMGNQIASKKCLLCDASIHALKMAGTMTVDGELWALIQSPSNISAVKIGDKIGEEQIPIIDITDHFVVFSNHFTLEMNHS